MNYFVFLVCMFCSTFLPSHGIKSLKDNPSFDNTAAWYSGYLPCALEQVVFPTTYAALLPLPQQVDVSGFILPHDGAVLLHQDMTIDLAGEISKPNSRSCESGSARRAYLKPPQVRKWYDPQSWNLVAIKKKNKQVIDDSPAITHLQRVPCDNEPVIITPKGPIAIDMENAEYMRMGQLSLAGSLVTREYMQYLLSTDLGEWIFHNSRDVMVEYYRDGVCGCHRDFISFNEPVCHNVRDECPTPHCLQPIVPYGSCCAVCGVALRFVVARCDDVKLNVVRKLLQKSRTSQGLEEDVVMDINYFHSKEFGKFLQILILDRYEYNERSVQFVQEFQSKTNFTTILEDPRALEILYAGRPYKPNVSLFSLLLIVLCLTFVSFVALVIFAHYRPHHEVLEHVPSWIYDVRQWRGLLTRTQLAFASLDYATLARSRRNTLADVQETTVDEANNMAIGFNAQSGRLRERSFDNPMFNKKTVEQTPQEAELSLETGSLTRTEEDTQTEDIQELREINLDSGSDDNDDESDIEAETKE